MAWAREHVSQCLHACVHVGSWICQWCKSYNPLFYAYLTPHWRVTCHLSSPDHSLHLSLCWGSAGAMHHSCATP